MRTSATLVSVFLLLAMQADVGAQNSLRLLPFQGRVADSAGAPLPDGPRVIRFRISESPVSNIFKWEGELHRATVNGGLINVVLGSKTPMDGVDFGKQVFLEVTVDANNDGAVTEADPPMLPRQAILPVVFAKEAEDSRKLAGYDWSVLFGADKPDTGSLDGLRLKEGSIPFTRLAQRPVGAAVPSGGIALSSTLTNLQLDRVGVILPIPELAITLQSSGRPVVLALTRGTFVRPDGNTSAHLGVEGTDASLDIFITIFRNAEKALEFIFRTDTRDRISRAFYLPISSCSGFDFPVAGECRYTVAVEAYGSEGAANVYLHNVRLVAYEL